MDDATVPGGSRVPGVTGAVRSVRAVRAVRADDLVIAGFEPYSSVDWPGRLVATVFLQGCPWRCTYCHNPAMQDTRAPGAVSWEEVVGLLRSRAGLLDGVVFSGGEPTRQAAALAAAMREVRRRGYLVGLHTAGAYPERLASLLPLTDWVGVDVKSPAHRYEAITGVDASGERAWRSLDLVVRSGVDYEPRMTVDPTVHGAADVRAVVAALQRRGAKAPVLQEARAAGADPVWAARLAGLTLADVVPADAAALERR